MHQTQKDNRRILAMPMCIGYSHVLVTPTEACWIFHYDAVHSANFDISHIPEKIRMMGLSKGEDLIILAWFVYSQHQQTDRQNCYGTQNRQEMDKGRPRRCWLDNYMEWTLKKPIVECIAIVRYRSNNAWIHRPLASRMMMMMMMMTNGFPLSWHEVLRLQGHICKKESRRSEVGKARQLNYSATDKGLVSNWQWNVTATKAHKCTHI